MAASESTSTTSRLQALKIQETTSPVTLLSPMSSAIPSSLPREERSRTSEEAQRTALNRSLRGTSSQQSAARLRGRLFFRYKRRQMVVRHCEIGVYLESPLSSLRGWAAAHDHFVRVLKERNVGKLGGSDA